MIDHLYRYLFGLVFVPAEFIYVNNSYILNIYLYLCPPMCTFFSKKSSHFKMVAQNENDS